MPEYLAPGVFVEEVDTGMKPIEGVSTSTAGMIGVTERGPVDVPILITSMGEFTRWFGERLSIEEFDDLCYLPYAVEGFFTNGGKRLYVTRVLDTSAAVRATFQLFDRGTAASADTVLLRRAGESSGTLANPPALYVLDPTTTNVGDFLRIGDGSNAEYHRVAAIGTAIQHVPLSFPLNLSHAAGVNVDGVARAVDAAFGGFTLDQPAVSGATSIVVTGAAADIAALAAATNPLLEIGPANVGEHRFAGASTALTATTARVELLGGPLVMDYAATAAVTVLDLTGAVNASLQPASSAGDSLIYVDSVAALSTRNDLAIIGAGGAGVEVRRIGELGTIDVSTGAAEDYPAGSVVEEVTVADDARALGAAVAANATSFTVAGNRLENLQPGTQVLVDPGANEETVTVASVVAPNVNIAAATGFANAHAAGATVIPDFDRKTLGTATAAGTSVIALANRVGLAANDVLRIGNAPDDEYVAIRSIPARAAAGADPGNVVLTQALQRGHAAGDPVRRQAAPAPTATQPTVLAAAVARASAVLVVTDGFGIAGGDFVRVSSPTGEQYFHRTPGGSTAANPLEVTLTTALTRAHDVGAPVVGRDPLLTVEALDAGAWGNRLRVSVEDEGTGLVSRTTLDPPIDPTHIRLGSAAGVEQGTILELTDPLNNNAVVGAPLKVDFVNRQANFTITLAGTGMDAAQQGAQAAAQAVGQKLGVRSREFRLSILLLHQADPARPTRNSIVIASEVFRHLSLDPRHSRYVHTVIGDTLGPLRLSDRRPEGESWYVRVHDPNPTAAVRLGPETLIDVLPNGQRRPARHPLDDGDDSVTTVSDATYIGTDNVDPDLRTGLFTMANIDDVSILAAPGRTTPAMQNALIAQCENLRYRFTVLDGPPPPADTIPDVQSLRQQYDTKYAALYHPWLLIDDPYPRNIQVPNPFPVPPSGSVIGIYARTDIERGVHKAPANEVVRGVIGLQRSLNKAEQEILNPFPQNINVIRDFRPNNRSIRVWGGRVITSDPDWKYVNVRRLLIFIEKSIDIGLQWVVFEPNADPLWARVRRTISMFLTGLWRDGALEGATREEAYFVKCDRTTMTQADIDNGRLIVVVGVAPVKPAEFVIIRIGLWTAHAEE
ncbi:MAG: phage tail sheath family protein [Vicinamibacterales bacterium]